MKARPHDKQMAFNVLAQIGPMLDNGYTRKEIEMVWESQKLLGDEAIILTRPANMSCSAAVCLPAERHRNAAIALLRQVSITPSAGRHTAAEPCEIEALNTAYLLAGLI